MFFLKSTFISLFLSAYSNPKHQEGVLGSVLTKLRDYLCLGIHMVSPNTMLVHSKLKQKAHPSPQGTQSILPSTSKIMLRPWGWGAVCPDSSSCQTVTLRKIFLSHF